jgi:type VI secretion system secreted protein Hcp
MDGTFEGIKPGGKGGPWVYIKFEFKEAMVTSYQINGSPDQIPTESITLNFTSIKEEYADQNSTGGRGAATNAGWDHKANKAL